jgi:microcystin degradation protein MlrC
MQKKIKKRIAIGQIWQEQNTFCPIKTTISDFKQNGLFYGKEIIEKFKGINELGGFIEAAKDYRKAEIELVPISRVWAWPKGNVTKSSYKKIKDDFLRSLKKSLPLDGILLSLHGSMVSDTAFDVEGDILESIHTELQQNIPIACSLDLHANITERMLENTIFMEAYHTCPHVDLLRTGHKAAEVFIGFICGELNLSRGFVKIPMITPARLHNTKYGPLKRIFDYLSDIEKRTGVISASFFPVQPWLDVPELGWSVLVYSRPDSKNSNDDNRDNKQYLGKNDPQEFAEEIADIAWKLRKDFFVEETLPSVAIKEAAKMKSGLMVISDSDSTASGGTGDNICILEELIKQNIEFPALLTIVDKETVKEAKAKGIGGIITCSIGGKMDKIFSKSLKITATVKNITEEKFVIDGHIGKNYVDMGMVAILEAGSITMLVSEKAGPVYEQNVYKSVGLNPSDFRVVVVKSPVGFRDAYEPIADKIVLADCPGLSSSNLKLFDYKNIPHPIFPFDKIKDRF